MKQTPLKTCARRLSFRVLTMSVSPYLKYTPCRGKQQQQTTTGNTLATVELPRLKYAPGAVSPARVQTQGVSCRRSYSGKVIQLPSRIAFPASIPAAKASSGDGWVGPNIGCVA